MSKSNNGTYQTCACNWRDGKVVSFCGAHQMVADERMNIQVADAVRRATGLLTKVSPSGVEICLQIMRNV